MMYRMPETTNMTFDGWQRKRREIERLEIGDDQYIDLNNIAYKVFFALDNICFDNMFHFFPLYWMSDQAKEQKPGVIGMYLNNRIMIDKEYFDSHGADDDFIELMFHEMIHGYCDWKRIKDTDGDKHLRGFASACELCGGGCDRTDSGWSESYLLPGTLAKVKQRINGRR